ncbi:MAG: hypothetical protein ABSG57_02925 [Candidatus Bathyarchaeia archaeon]
MRPASDTIGQDKVDLERFVEMKRVNEQGKCTIDYTLDISNSTTYL